MKQQSWRNHYLPVFYLRGFTKDSGLFKIFDVEKKQFVQRGKEFSPQSYFFKKHDNTIFHDDKSSDFVEKGYGDLENKVSKILAKVDQFSWEEQFGINEYDVQMIDLFAILIHWRLPHNKILLELILKENELKSLGFSVTNKINGERDIEHEEMLRNNPEFVKAYKILNALMDYARGFNCRTPFSIIPKHEQLPYICSDNPVIFRNKSENVYEDDYVFPLTGKRIFLKTKKRENFDHYIWMLSDILVYKQAKKYVSCTSVEYLKMLDDTFEKYNMTLEEFKEKFFERLD